MPSMRLELDAGLAPRPLDQRAAVLRLADGARRDGAVRVDLPAVHLLPELAERRARLAHRRGREATGEEHLGAEPHRRAQRGQIFQAPRRRAREGQLPFAVVRGRRSLDDAQAERVGAHVDCGKARHEQKLAGACLIG